MSQSPDGSGPESVRTRDADAPREFDDMVDEQSAQSFPCSDPPSFTPGSQYGMSRANTQTQPGRQLV